MVMKFTWEATRKRNYQGRKVKVASVHERGYHDMKNKTISPDNSKLHDINKKLPRH